MELEQPQQTSQIILLKKVALCSIWLHKWKKKKKTQIDNAEEIHEAKATHNLIEYSDNYLTTSGSL